MTSEIENVDQYETLLAEAERLIGLNPKLGTRDANRLMAITPLIEEYEKKHFPIEKPDPIEAAQFRLEQQGK
jgi:HTH-type transcriptional regulator/antitoxin HigA